MTGFALSPRASEDLDEIWDYTAQHWGMDQADRYVRHIVAVCSDLASGRKRGRSAEAVRAGYFRYVVGSHILFYRIGGAGQINVIRILHQRMDVEQHFQIP